LVFERSRRPLALGFFDRYWQVPVPPKIAGDESPADPVVSDAAPAITVSPTPDAGLLQRPVTPSKPKTAVVSKKPRTPKPLPIPPSPPVPPIPTSFLAPESDPAGIVARKMAQRINTFFNYRAYISGATWVVDPKAVWSIRPEQECLEAMRQQGIAVHLYKKPVRMPIATPVEIKEPIEGVRFQHGHAGPIVMSCELATRLPVLAKVVRQLGVHTVIIASAFRDKPQTSFHSMGLALDISQVITDDGPVSVWGNYQKTPDATTCEAPTASKANARLLRAIACDLATTRVFSTVITPNYNEGHRDHYHIDIRPDDPRFFLR
jgi:hypothetical protein